MQSVVIQRKCLYSQKIRQLGKTINGSPLETWTEQDLKKTQRETTHLYLAQAVSQVLQAHAMHAERKGTISLLIKASCRSYIVLPSCLKSKTMSSTHLFARPYHSKKYTILHISNSTSSRFKQLGALQVPKSAQSLHFKTAFFLSGGNKRAANSEDS